MRTTEILAMKNQTSMRNKDQLELEVFIAELEN